MLVRVDNGSAAGMYVNMDHVAVVKVVEDAEGLAYIFKSNNNAELGRITVDTDNLEKQAYVDEILSHGKAKKGR